MGVLDFLKPRRRDLPLPPPPMPPDMPSMMRGDIEPIQAKEHEQDLTLPELPAPDFTQQSFERAQDIPERAPETMPAFSMPEQLPELPEFKLMQPAREKEERAEVIRPTIRPTFVAVDDYKRIINDTNIIRSKLIAADDFVKKLSDLKNEEERAIDRWRHQLEDVEKKLNYVDQLIATAQR